MDGSNRDPLDFNPVSSGPIFHIRRFWEKPSREGETIARLYDAISAVSFSDNVLAEFCKEFLVLPVRDLGWNDLGEPARVLNTIAQLELRPKMAGRLIKLDGSNRWSRLAHKYSLDLTDLG